MPTRMIIRYLIPFFMRGSHYTTICGRTMKTRNLILIGVALIAGFNTGILRNPINVDKLASYITYQDSDRKKVDTRKTGEKLSEASGLDKVGKVAKTVLRSMAEESNTSDKQ